MTDSTTNSLRASPVCVAHQDAAAGQEADVLIDLALRNCALLRQAKLNERFVTEGATFRMIQSDRNRLFRVALNRDWYLKLPEQDGRDAIEREIDGCRRQADVLSDSMDYMLPAAVRASLDPPLLLVAEMKGRPLHRSFYAAAFGISQENRKRVGRCAWALGRNLATLHRGDPAHAAAAANRPVRRALEDLLIRARPGDSTSERIAGWLSNLPPIQQASVPLHGNLKLENVLCGTRGIALLDFENCGVGVASEDLSWPVSQWVLTDCAFGFPQRQSRAAVQTFLDGYVTIAELAKDDLQRFVAMRLARYYLEFMAGKFGWARIAGLPVRRKRLVVLLEQMLAGQPIEDWMQCCR